MKNILLGLLCVASFLLVPAASRAAPPAQEASSELTTSITVLGYGTAAAAPDSVRVTLHIGEEPTYGPGGPEMSIIDPADLEHVRDLLIKKGIEENVIEINFLSRSYSYGPSNYGGAVTFSYSELDNLRTLLQTLLDEMKARRGPAIQGASIVFLVEDCATLEKEAMKAALNDARQRALQMVELLEMSLGRVIAVSEDVSPSSALLPAGGCIAFNRQRTSGAFTAYTTLGGAGSLVNSPSKVEIAITLKTTFALEP